MILRLFLSVFLLCLGIQLNAQHYFRQSLDSLHMLIGDQQVLTQQSSGKPLEPELFNQLKKLEWLEVIDAGQWNFTPAQVYERKIKFSVFDSGYFRIPSLEVRIDSQKISTEPLDLRVDLAVDSTAELLPIKDIVLTREPGYRWIFFVVAGIIGLLVLVLLYFLMRADRVRPGKIVYTNPAKPHELALQRLEELDQQKLWQNGQVKEYYDALLNVLRTFLLEGFRLSAHESTTRELSNKMEATGIPWQKKDELFTWMNYSDLIRFANRESKATDHVDAMLAARSFVLANKDNSLDFLNEHKLDYRHVLGREAAEQFEYPDMKVPDELLQLLTDGPYTQLTLFAGLSNAKSFQLPEQWCRLHIKNQGQIMGWHANLMQSYRGWKGILLLLLLLPLIAAFIPFLLIISLIKKENIFSRGVFVLSKSDKLMVDETKLGQ
ncbi:MAG: hypothetical protein U0V49_02935 [Saprospiraceae bacterium]